MADGLEVTVLALANEIVLLEFGQPVQRVELPIDDALTLAMTIMRAVANCDPHQRKVAKAVGLFMTKDLQ